MASLLSRSACQVASNISRRAPNRMVHLSAMRSADQMMPDPVEHATGLEKYELLAKQAGNEDPFFLKAVVRAKVMYNSCQAQTCVEDEKYREPRMRLQSSMPWTTTE